MKIKKIGTFTFGIMLIIFGVLFIFRIFYPNFSYEIILKFWPIMFIFLGFEILIANHKIEESELIYDKTAFILIIILTFFAMGMAIAEISLNYASRYLI